jgi:hypothetical protein
MKFDTVFKHLANDDKQAIHQFVFAPEGACKAMAAEKPSK